MSKVELFVYDLSRGMAVAMSQQILGQQIDGIWHTGVVAFGREYYFGGGIQVSPIGAFASQSNLQPSRVVSLGETNKTADDLSAFLRTVNHRFTQATYDLIRNNCNNFSNEVSIFLTGNGIPSYIIDLPNIVFSSPGGAMLRPMIEGMQQNIQQQTGHSFDPFGGASGTGGNTITSGMPAPSSSSSSGDFESDLARAIEESLLAQHVATNEAPAVDETIAFKAQLDELPLTSNDFAAVTALGSKIINFQNTGPDGSKLTALSDKDQMIVRNIMTTLSDTASLDSTSLTSDSFAVIKSVLESYPALEMAALFILRLMVLQKKVDYAASSFRELQTFLLNKLTKETKSFGSAPATIMGVCVLANQLSHDRGIAVLLSDSIQQAQLIDIAISGLSHSRPEVRQISSALAYNYVLACTSNGVLSGPWLESPSDEMNDQAIQFLCGAFDNIASEVDLVVRKRRLSIACRVFRCYGEIATVLAQELGYHDLVRQLLGINPKEPEQLVLKELTSILN